MSTAVARFEAKIFRTNRCWLWTGGQMGKGYGGFRGHNSVRTYAHRFSHETYIGPIPDGQFVCHECDNPACVNPDHLFLGSQFDNMADAHRKGRTRKTIPRGELHPSAKLTSEQVLIIRESPKSLTELAAEYGVRLQSIYAIKKRLSWRHI